jgi:hypothetical protein
LPDNSHEAETSVAGSETGSGVGSETRSGIGSGVEAEGFNPKNFFTKLSKLSELDSGSGIRKKLIPDPDPGIKRKKHRILIRNTG